MGNKVRTEVIEHNLETFKVKFNVFTEDGNEPVISVLTINGIDYTDMEEDFLKDIVSACMQFLIDEHLSKLDEHADQKYSAAKEDW